MEIGMYAVRLTRSFLASLCAIADIRIEGEVLVFELYINRKVFKKSSYPMPYLSILEEAYQLNDVSKRLKLLSAQHPFVEEALLTLSGNICHTATLLEVLVAIKTANSAQSDN
jgi:hypothetical protein